MPADDLTIQPSYVVAWQRRQNAIVDYADDRTRYGRTKGPIYTTFDLTFRNRTASEYSTFLAFYDLKWPSTSFLWTEKTQNIQYTCYFISDISAEVEGDCAVTWRVRMEGTTS